MHALPAREKRRVPRPRRLRFRLVQTGQIDLNVPDVVRRVGFANLHPERTMLAVHMNFELAGFLVDDFRVIERQLPFTAVPNRINPGRVMPALDGAKRRFGVTARLEAANPALRVQSQFRPAAPAGALALTYPSSGLHENVGERKLCAPVRCTVEVDSHRGFGNRKISRSAHKRQN